MNESNSKNNSLLSAPGSRAFAVFSDQSKSLNMDNWQAAHEQISPFSTFKIANTLFALDSKIIDSHTSKLSYDKNQYPAEPWWPKSWLAPKLSVREAFEQSAVPFYRQLANNIGAANMQGYLHKLNYGNRDMSSGTDNFWLAGSLKISVVEQVSFLRRLFAANRPVSEHAVTQLKKTMLADAWGDYNLYAKTGTGKLKEGLVLGWYVGFLEKKDGKNRYYFAAAVTEKSIRQVQTSRIGYATQQLQKFTEDLTIPKKIK